MIRTLLYDPATKQVTHGTEAQLEAWERDPKTLIWADFADNEPQEQAILVERFGLHPLAVSDAQRDRHPPKIECFKDNVFILLKGLGDPSDSALGREPSERFELNTVQLALFIGERFLVTRHAKASPSIELLRQEADQLAVGTDALAIRLCRILADRYTKALLALEPRLDDLEVAIVDRPNDTMLAELIGYKTELRKFRRVLLYQVQVFSELLKTPPPVRQAQLHEIRDVYEHQERASSLAALYYEVSSDLIDGYISLASHHLNNIIKVLTIVTTIFVPLSFLAGIYGMNFEYMPELRSPQGYFVLLGVMAFIATTLVFLFRKQRWL